MITRYNPFKDLVMLRDEVNRAFDEKFLKDESAPIFSPRVDISETETNIILKAELPGINKENININAANDSISISGERTWIEKEGEKYHKVERYFGKFERTFSIGIPIDPDNIKASFKDGVLEILLPKTEKGNAKKIEISAE